MIIEMIQKENDIKKLDHTQLKELAEEIRGFLLDKISCTGGHLASNLGVAVSRIIRNGFSTLWLLFITHKLI